MSYKNIVDIMADIVADATTNVLPTIQANNLVAQAAIGSPVAQDISSIRYMYGHPVELVDTLKELTNSRTEKYSIWPVIMLFTDIAESHGITGGYPIEYTLNMVIATYTDPNYKADTRRVRNFVPILQPIYEQLLESIAASSELTAYPARAIIHTKTDRYYWGKTGLNGNTGNQYNDCIDAIEINNLRIKKSLKQICN